jgi:urease accessory protein
MVTSTHGAPESQAARPAGAIGASLLLLADSRLPAGGHAHSGGLEAAVAAGSVDGMTGLEGFLRGRLATAGLTAAGLAAAACQHAAAVTGGAPPRWHELDAEAAARTPAPAQRHAARAQGRALLRVARVTWPHPLLDTLDHSGPTHAAAPGTTDPFEPGERVDGPFLPVALGACGWLAGGTPADAAVIAASAAITGPASAAVRLLGLDPLAVTGLLGRLAAQVMALAHTACQALANGNWAALPAPAAPGLDLLAQRHVQEEVAFFES